MDIWTWSRQLAEVQIQHWDGKKVDLSGFERGWWLVLMGWSECFRNSCLVFGVKKEECTDQSCLEPPR